jgi:hypothetical protein
MDHVVLQATNDPDTLYYHQVLNEPDKDMFITAMEHEIKQHNANQNWVPVKRSAVPSTSRILLSVWSMRRKRDLTTGTSTMVHSPLHVLNGTMYRVNNCSSLVLLVNLGFCFFRFFLPSTTTTKTTTTIATTTTITTTIKQSYKKKNSFSKIYR